MTALLTALLTNILLAAEGMPVTVRLLDAARHELMDDSVGDTGPAAGIVEVNPMMGTRGARDFLVNADLGVAQVVAIARSRRAVAELGLHTDVRILVPMVGFSEEFRRAKQVIEDVFTRETPGAHSCPPVVGCMIEVPRIALNAADLAAILLRSAAMSGDTTLRGKLVRDRIPEIILREGLVPIVETASPQDYDRYVHAKLEEELAEYLSSGDVAEVANLVEVCFAAAALHGVGPDELLAIARDKRQQRGGFDDRLVWMGNLPGGHESQ
ncbi:MAG: putative PEP-binding protein [Pseudonocardiaceae bacterium]